MCVCVRGGGGGGGGYDKGWLTYQAEMIVNDNNVQSYLSNTIPLEGPYTVKQVHS